MYFKIDKSDVAKRTVSRHMHFKKDQKDQTNGAKESSKSEPPELRKAKRAGFRECLVQD